MGIEIYVHDVPSGVLAAEIIVRISPVVDGNVLAPLVDDLFAFSSWNEATTGFGTPVNSQINVRIIDVPAPAQPTDTFEIILEIPSQNWNASSTVVFPVEHFVCELVVSFSSLVFQAPICTE